MNDELATPSRSSGQHFKEEVSMGVSAGCIVGERVLSNQVPGVEDAATSLQVAPMWREKLVYCRRIGLSFRDVDKLSCHWEHHKI